MIVKATPKNCKNIKSKIEINKKNNFKELSFILNFLIFKANKGISAFRIKALKIEIKINTQGFINNSSTNNESVFFKIRGKLIINIAFAGVGKPMKDSVCRVSILKLANL